MTVDEKIYSKMDVTEILSAVLSSVRVCDRCGTLMLPEITLQDGNCLIESHAYTDSKLPHVCMCEDCGKKARSR